MSWISISLRVKAEFADILGEALIARGSAGVWEEEPGWVTAYFPATADPRVVKALLEEMSVSFGQGDCVISPVSDQDWIATWKASVVPLRVTPRLVIVPSWQTYRAEPGERIVVLDPGMAFGTGHHETTRTCLRLLDERLCRGDRPSVLDLGTGSGILAIAAAKLGAARVVAAEVDPEARSVAEANVERNGVASLVTVTDADSAFAAARFDLAVANLTAEALMELSPKICGALAPGGEGILGGILADREEAVRRVFESRGLRVDRNARDGEWTGLVVRSPGNNAE